MGISESLYIPAGLALIADYHRGNTRSLAVGIHITGLYAGQVLGGCGMFDAGNLGRDLALLAIPVAVAVILLLSTLKPIYADKATD
jgi:MFS family permease